MHGTINAGGDLAPFGFLQFLEHLLCLGFNLVGANRHHRRCVINQLRCDVRIGFPKFFQIVHQRADFAATLAALGDPLERRFETLLYRRFGIREFLGIGASEHRHETQQ